MKTVALLFIALTSATLVIAQDSVSLPLNKFSFGVSGGLYDGDQGLMMSVTTPYFIDNRVATRISGGMLWSEIYYAEKGSFARYGGVLTGLVLLITDQKWIRVYAEPGIATVFPHHTFSDKSAVPMFYGLAGLDFYFRRLKSFKLIYFIEFGCIANTSQAEKLEGQPDYCNGTMGITGFRFHL
jgi:hypothetical protein